MQSIVSIIAAIDGPATALAIVCILALLVVWKALNIVSNTTRRGDPDEKS